MSKSPKKKRSGRSIFKFLKNRKSVSVALGICLAVAGSVYIATAKFSADSPSEKLTPTGLYMISSIKVVDKNGNTITDAQTTLYEWNKNGSLTEFIKGVDILDILELCKDGSGKIFMCDSKGAALLDGFAAKVNVPGAKTYSWRQTLIAKNVDELNKKYEKINDVTYKAPTIILRSDGKSGKVEYWKNTTTSSATKTSTSTSSGAKFGGISLVPTDKKIYTEIRVIDKKTKSGVAGLKVVEKSRNLYSDNNTDWGDNGTNSVSDKDGAINDYYNDICKDSRGWYYACRVDDKKNITSRKTARKVLVGEDTPSNKNRKVQYNIPQPLARSETELNKKFLWKDTNGKPTLFYPTIYLYSDGSGGYVGPTSDKASSPKTSAASKVTSAVKSAVKKVTSKTTGAKIKTTPTSKDKVTFSESLPAQKINMTKTLNFELKDNDTHELTNKPVIVTTVFKECTSGGCSGTDGKVFNQQVEHVSEANGMHQLTFGVVNIPQIKKSILTGKTTTVNRYFLTSGAAYSTQIIRRMYVSDINGNNQREINIGGFPFATNSESAAQKFQLKLVTFDKVVSQETQK